MQSLRKAQAQAEEDQYKEFHFFFSFLVLQYAYLQSIPKWKPAKFRRFNLLHKILISQMASSNVRAWKTQLENMYNVFGLQNLRHKCCAQS